MKTSIAENALDAWASARHHAAQGADGHPDYQETLNEPAPCSGDRSDAARSDLTYDGTRNKYTVRRRPKVDIKVLAAIESVERALDASGAPEWLKLFLLFKYPTRGRFVPSRPAQTDEEDDALAFVSCGHMASVVGGLWSDQLLMSMVRTVRAAEREFKIWLRRELSNRPKQARGPQAPGARSDSRAPA